MASTHVTLRNESDLKVYAKLKWAASKIDDAHIEVGGKAHLDCEYVWYDLYVYRDIQDGELLSKRTGIYGYSSWIFKKNSDGTYYIEAD